jgi:hydroxymethylpyrimidine/phosphomethylpyrimidine kinase
MLIPKALTIAGSDSGGGAGIQADLKTFSAFRVFGMSVITAVTAQNSLGVQGVENLPPAFVARQLRSVLGDFGTDAAKCGMLSTAAIIEAVAETLAELRVEKLVVDPVMVAKSGDPLLQADARTALADRILPLALVVTPNLPEAEVLAGMRVAEPEDIEEAARLWNGREFTRFTAARVDSANTHGTGCTFSAAIAAGLARGQALGDAIRSAKAYVTRAIREGFKAGRGVGQLRHFIPDW